jgi:hypothetical protein
MDAASSAGLGLTDADLPDIHDGADRASLRAQRHYIHATRAKLILACLAAGLAALSAGPLDDARSVGISVGICFLGILLVEAYVWATGPERDWYDGRAIAESAKTMAWRYAVAAAPYGMAEVAAEERFLSDLAQLLRDAPDTELRPTERTAVTPAMRRLRSADLAHRRAVYLADRLADQLGWYADKARVNRARAVQWRICLLAAEGSAIVLAFAGSADLAGLASALVASGAAWMGVRQHESTGRAYTFAARELVIARNLLEPIDEELRWSRAVADAEEAISREHTMWRASRSSTGY